MYNFFAASSISIENQAPDSSLWFSLFQVAPYIIILMNLALVVFIIYLGIFVISFLKNKSKKDNEIMGRLERIEKNLRKQD